MTTTDYKVGSLTNLIQKSSKKKKDHTSREELSQLAALFSTPTKIITESETLQTSEKKQNKKRSLDNGQNKTGAKKKKTKDKSKPVGYDPPPGVVHEALKSTNKSEENTEGDKTSSRKIRNKNKRDRTKDPRTIFVGNLPITYDKKHLKKLFKSCGKIESVRFRCAPPADLKLPKRAVAITKSFHKERNNIISYVCFAEEESAQKALKLNGKDIEGFHIRVDISNNAKKHNKNTTVFIGNMTYDVTENEVRDHFEDCGEIVNVRIVRDNKTGMGKGIGYIQFKEKDGVDFALKLHQSSLKGRELRVMRCDVKTAKKQKVKMVNDKSKKRPGKIASDKKSSSTSEKKKMSFRSTNKKTNPFKRFDGDKKKHLKKMKTHGHQKGHSKQKPTGKVKSKHKKFK